MKKQIILFITLTSLLFACGEKKEGIKDIDNTYVFREEQVDTTLFETINKIDFLALEANDEADIFEANKILLRNGLIFIGDFHACKIVVYDMNGKYLYALNQKGAGPKEYLEIKSFTVDNNYIYVLDNFRHQIKKYDCFTGEFVGTNKLSFVAWDVEWLDHDKFLFAFVPLHKGRVNMDQPACKVWLTDSTFQIKEKYFPYTDKEYEFIGKSTYFASMKEGVVFHSMSADEFTVFYKNDSVQRIALDFENKIPIEYRNDNKTIQKGNYNYLFATPLMCKDYVSCEISIHEDIWNYVYDTKKNCFLSNPLLDGTKFFMRPNASYENKFIYYLDNKTMYEELIHTGFQKADLSVEQHLQNEGTVLILYTMQ